MISKKDTENLLVAFSQVFATKEELRQLEQRLEEKFVTNERFDEAMGKLDLIIGIVKATQEELQILTHQHKNLNNRVEILETVCLPAHYQE